MFSSSSSSKIERGVENVARKIGIDPKVASKTWNTMSSYTKNVSDNFAKSRTKLLKRSNSSETASANHSYQRLPHHTSHLHQNPSKSGAHQKPYNFIKYSLFCVLFFACILLLNFIFTKHLDSKTKRVSIDKFVVFNAKPNKTQLMHHDLEKDIDELFAKINSNQTTNDPVTNAMLAIDEDPTLEEKSMQSLRQNVDQNEAKQHDDDLDILDIKKHEYHEYPSGLSDVDHNGIYYISMIADMDHASKTDEYKWRSFLQHVKLTINDDNIDIEFIPPPFAFNTESVRMMHCDGISANDTCFTVIIDGFIGERGRGMELSELVRFDGALLSFDDRSGIIYEISREFEAIPRHILMEGDGNNGKGMKIEWATFKKKEELLYIGSIGREYTNIDGSKIRKLGLLWIATMDKNGVIQHHDWTQIYMRLRRATATLFPGYLWIEAVEWSDVQNKWFIAPRYVSFDKYNYKLSEKRGCNLLIVADEYFENIQLVWIKFKVRNNKIERKLLEDESYYKTMHDLNAAELRSMSVKQENMKLQLQHSNKGFSTIRFLPNTNDTLIVAIQTQENDKEIVDSFLCVFDILGNVLIENKRIPFQKKYEGLVIL